MVIGTYKCSIPSKLKKKKILQWCNLVYVF